MYIEGEELTVVDYFTGGKRVDNKRKNAFHYLGRGSRLKNREDPDQVPGFLLKLETMHFSKEHFFVMFGINVLVKFWYALQK